MNCVEEFGFIKGIVRENQSYLFNKLYNIATSRSFPHTSIKHNLMYCPCLSKANKDEVMLHLEEIIIEG